MYQPRATIACRAASLTTAQFEALSEVPEEVEWLANIQSRNTRIAYQRDVRDFIRFAGVENGPGLRGVTRAHVIAWRQSLQGRSLEGTTIRRKLAALASMFDYLCEKNVILSNPVDGVERPRSAIGEGKTPALGPRQAKVLLDCPSTETLKGVRDRAVLAVFLFHAVRCDELCRLRVKDLHSRYGEPTLRIHGKGGKIRFITAHSEAVERIRKYVGLAGHASEPNGSLFRPCNNRVSGILDKPLSPSAVYERIVLHYARKAGIYFPGFCIHSLRATAITTALENAADITAVQRWAGHASILTTKLYDRRCTDTSGSPTASIRY